MKDFLKDCYNIIKFVNILTAVVLIVGYFIGMIMLLLNDTINNYECSAVETYSASGLMIILKVYILMLALTAISILIVSIYVYFKPNLPKIKFPKIKFPKSTRLSNWRKNQRTKKYYKIYIKYGFYVLLAMAILSYAGIMIWAMIITLFSELC